MEFLYNCFLFIHDKGIAVVITNKNYSYGIAIIVFTIIIRIILLPLGIKSMKSQLKMTEVQPEVKKLQEKYKKDPAKLNEATMKLYKEKGVNPLGGCLPLLVQMPVLMALYTVFRKDVFIGHSFLWIGDLSKTDLTQVHRYFILAILSGATTYISSTLLAAKGDSAQAKQASTMNIVMGGFLTFMSLSMPASLVLYWVFGNLFQIGQTIVIKKSNKKSLEEA
ncbi:MAG: membrane protein insertase YidC [Clostridiaceae bacterium]|nr:membrane protein insertase YidC [Clostridiaceae bacterium]